MSAQLTDHVTEWQATTRRRALADVGAAGVPERMFGCQFYNQLDTGHQRKCGSVYQNGVPPDLCLPSLSRGFASRSIGTLANSVYSELRQRGHQVTTRATTKVREHRDSRPRPRASSC